MAEGKLKEKRLGELWEVYPGLRAVEDVAIRGIAYDSRRVGKGDLFVAVRGMLHDGHTFLPQAVANGAVAVVVEEKSPGLPVPQLVVENSRRALGSLAAAFYDQPSRKLRVAGVTGTNGKTTTAGFLRSIMEAGGERTGLIGTVETIVGGGREEPERTTPESADLQRLLAKMVEAKDAAVVMEVSSHALALNRVEACEFDLGVFTNLTQDHMDFHRTLEHYRQAKGKLFAALGMEATMDDSRCVKNLRATPSRTATFPTTSKSKNYPRGAALNLDDPSSQYFLGLTRVPVLFYGFSPGATIRAKSLKLGTQTTAFTLVLPGVETQVNLRLPGRFNVANALAAATAAHLAGISLEAIVDGLEGFNGVRGRMERVVEGQEFTVLVDYAHTPDGLEKVLTAVREVAKGRVIVVFGCGGDRDRGKRPLMGGIAARLADFVFLTSDNPRSEDPRAILAEVEAGFREARKGSCAVVEDRSQAIQAALEMAQGEDVVLIAGKGHEGYQLFRDRRVPFDDVQVAKSVLRRLGGAR